MKWTGLKIAHRKTMAFLVLILALASAFVLYSQSYNTYIMKTSVLDESGGSPEAADKKMIATSAGQPTPIGVSSSPNYNLYAGYIYTLGDDCVITITSPNGNEIWCVGQTYNITWTSDETSGNVKIEYSTNGGSRWFPIVSDTPDDGSYEWTIPDLPNLPFTTCLIRICDVANLSCCDRSNSTFQMCDCGTMEITTESLPDGTQGCSYDETVEAIGGCYPYSWSIVSGSLPDGVYLDGSSGTISGNPTEIGSFDFTLRVTDGLGDTYERELSIHIDEYTDIKGDVNGDCAINVIDVVLLTNCCILVMCPCSEDMRARGDINGPPGNCDGDGRVNVLDSVKIINIILQLDECP